MLSFIMNNLGTIIVCAVLILIIGGVVLYMIRNKKKGKTSCGCGCEGCAMKDSCHSQNANTSPK